MIIVFVDRVRFPPEALETCVLAAQPAHSNSNNTVFTGPRVETSAALGRKHTLYLTLKITPYTPCQLQNQKGKKN